MFPAANDAIDTPVVTEEETSVTSATPESEAYEEFLEFIKKHSKEDGTIPTSEEFKEIIKKHFEEDGSLPSVELYQEILEKSTVDDMPFSVIEKAPVYPGCESEER